MTEEKLEKLLNELREKIRAYKSTLKEIEELRRRSIVVTDFNNGSIRIPDELHNVLLTLLEDYYTRKLNELKDKFAEAYWKY